MNSAPPYQLLANLVLLLHVAIVVFVIVGLLFIIVGNWRGWRLANAFWFRLLHLAAIAIVVAQAWLGEVCPLTTLEMWLRTNASEASYSGSFIAYWLQQLLYFEAPPWLFTLSYSLFGLAVAVAWWRFPPRGRGRS